jgi:hypothetical protein
MIAAKGGASEPPNIGLPGKAGGAVAVRRTLANTICRIADPTQVSRPRQLRDASTVMRFQPAHQSMINRRFNDRASCPARKSPKPALARKPQIYSPASGKGGHESEGELCGRRDDNQARRHRGQPLFVVGGSVDVCVAPDRQEPEARLACVDAGSVVGELALLSNRRRTADEIAVTTVSARVLTAADFALIARSHPRIHAKLIAAVGESLSDRLWRANAVIASLMR